MRISDEKIKSALNRIQEKKKNTLIEAVLNDLDMCTQISDPVLALKKLNDMEHVFAMISEQNKDGSIDVYNEIMASLRNSISEHMHILVSHAKEVLGDNAETFKVYDSTQLHSMKHKELKCKEEDLEQCLRELVGVPENYLSTLEELKKGAWVFRARGKEYSVIKSISKYIITNNPRENYFDDLTFDSYEEASDYLDSWLSEMGSDHSLDSDDYNIELIET